MENIIELAGVKKSFGTLEVLKDINLVVKKGENVVVVGKSGQGKSVTIKCIAGMIAPDAGSIKVFDDEVTDMDEDALRALRVRMGFLFQSGALYDSMTVRENLAFPLRRVLKMKDEQEIEARSVEVLEAVGLSGAIDKMPSDLSGGMRKRMGLARTIIVKPEIMLYDEPTTGLDTITSKEISALICSIKEKYKTTSIIITHDMACAKITADRVVIINNGICIANGTYGDLESSADKLISSFFN
jgi:phospholipid/cholesterol/gamma-HCH transport system ATP-binding protein